MRPYEKKIHCGPLRRASGRLAGHPGEWGVGMWTRHNTNMHLTDNPRSQISKDCSARLKVSLGSVNLLLKQTSTFTLFCLYSISRKLLPSAPNTHRHTHTPDLLTLRCKCNLASGSHSIRVTCI